MILVRPILPAPTACSWFLSFLRIVPHSFCSVRLHHQYLSAERTSADTFLLQYTPNGVPIPKDSRNQPDSHSFMHAIHHPDRIRPDHEWVDWFVRFKAGDGGKTVGLEFKESLWAEKLALIAIIITIAIIVVSIVWCLRGGDLQTVFTVMGFVLSGAAGEYITSMVVEVSEGSGALRLIILQLRLRWLHCTTKSPSRIERPRILLNRIQSAKCRPRNMLIKKEACHACMWKSSTAGSTSYFEAELTCQHRSTEATVQKKTRCCNTHR